MVVDDKSQASILTQCVWNNQFILVGKKSLYCKALHEAGLCYIYQLFDKSGETLQFDFWNEKGVPNMYWLKYMAIVHSVKKEKKKKKSGSVGLHLTP